MFKKVSIILGIILMMGLIGCSAETEAPSENPFIGGTLGLVADFGEMGVMNDATGVNEIYTGEAFPIEVVLQNKGEHDVPVGDLSVTLKGINLNDFTGIVTAGQLSNDELIEKISEFNSLGGEIDLDFTPGATDAVYTGTLPGDIYDVDVFGEVVYKYKTYSVVPKVCYKENLQDARICEVEEIKEVFASGAPVQVISAEEKGAGTGKVAVEFVVQNVGGGDVTHPDAEFDRRYDQLTFSIDDSAFECKSAGRLNEARLDASGKAIIICKLKEALPAGTLYTKQLGLTLDYKYRELIQESVRIKSD